MPEPAPSVVMNTMLTALSPFVPAPIMGLPSPSLTVAKAEIRPAGIGNYIGSSPQGSIAAIERQATRLKAVARFSLWGNAAAEVDDVVTALNTAIFEKRADLAAQGFLKLSFDGSVPSEQDKNATAWRRFADYDLLYEFTYEDEESTAGLILPILAQDTPTAAAWSTTADFGRWDDVAAPPFNLRGPAIFTELAALTFIAAAPPTGAVTITRTFDGAPAPADANDLATFLAQTTAASNPERNVFVSFPSLAALLAEFDADGAPIAMGDRDQNSVTDTYVPSHLVLPAPLVLEGVADRLELTYAGPQLDQIAVVYLRAIRKEAST
ncbi:MAG: hypothetical protein WCE79_05645 [Xanthobacteraceae bacterium]